MCFIRNVRMQTGIILPIILVPILWLPSKWGQAFFQFVGLGRLLMSPRLLLSKLAMRPWKAVATVCVFLVFICPSAHATDQLDISTGLKTLLLMTNRVSGLIAVAVVFDPANPESRMDAENIRSAIDSGNGVPGGLKMTAELVGYTSFLKSTDAKVAFLAKAIPVSSFDTISATAQSSGILTISTDLDCVKSGKCVLGIMSKPRVEIYYSPAAAEAAHINFAPAFIMLAKQV